jgi:branched-chain amino acid transport system permease protein
MTRSLLDGAMVGFFSAIPVILLVLIGTNFDVRNMFVNVSPALMDLLTFGLGTTTGLLALLGVQIVLGIVGASLPFIPDMVRRPILIGIGSVLTIGMLSELVIQIFRSPVFRGFLGNSAVRAVFDQDALKPVSALVIFVVATLLSALWINRRDMVKARYAALPSGQQGSLRWSARVVSGIVLLMLPWILGVFLSEVLDNVGLYILMALGLNIAVGLAGLLDLGYVTNFAVGAYVMGVLTSTGPLGIGEFPFWIVLPVCILAAMFTGFMLALPVLRMRGDYLAIATLGFGEIIRLLALSNWLAPYIGGAQGVLFIPKPQITGIVVTLLDRLNISIPTIVFTGPQQVYYIILAACLLMLFISLRLNNSRTGRKWMAMREDEDAAGAMGIDTVTAKLLAFTLSAASGGLAGAIFASKLGTIFPHSFSLLISINVLSIIIVGGMGSIPGIVVGAFALIGLPELLREFAEYRLLLYGALLIVMMLTRPEGLWPSAARRRELHADEKLATAIGD